MTIRIDQVERGEYDGTLHAQRQVSILWWLQRHPQVVHYRVLDVDPREFDDELAGKLILCRPLDGICVEQVQAQIRDWLEAGWDQAATFGIMN